MQEVMSLEGKTIVVTGAAQGIGQAVANLAITLGGRVIGIDLNCDKLNAFAATTNGRLLPYVGKVVDPEFAEATVRHVTASVGSINGLVNNAGITRPAMIEKMTLQHWSDVIAVHLSAISARQTLGARPDSHRDGQLLQGSPLRLPLRG
jgi:3-oxoacyl-[acyl-carrier protein] reductase